MPLYAAYGSNLDPRRMVRRAPHSPIRGTGWLVGWRLTFGGENLSWEGAFATVVEAPEDPDAHVFVLLYDVPAEDEPGLDEWEDGGTGLFRKVRVRVHTLDGDVTAWLYVLDAYEGGLPSARYIGMLADAAEAAGAPGDYVDELRARPCLSTGPGVPDA
ncbi:AIG2 family protein [Motilibacter rhizosphaerae]|uniref:AIG2 family protein n=1 Tax=Motilibacter rhizosphaerae TaxID=598652 RepID=A0A4Q7NT56_9ACTN|nr:gamma-glutamylcyclotransferase family protein [Motilibacter rhizosphaerae]RZS90245.1 AIG2 family protein [Motilibacter rhizosphaerae]